MRAICVAPNATKNKQASEAHKRLAYAGDYFNGKLFSRIISFPGGIGMLRFVSFSSLALTAFGAIAGTALSAEPASAAIYCRAVGVPKGCVVR